MLMKAILLRDQHLHELPSSSEQSLKLLRRIVDDRSRRGTDRSREKRQDLRVDFVGFFQLSERLCEVSDLPRIHGNTGQSRGEELTQRLSLITASSLQHYQRHLTGLQVFDELRDSSIVVGVPRAARFIVECDIQMRLRDVDAYEQFSSHNRIALSASEPPASPNLA